MVTPATIPALDGPSAPPASGGAPKQLVVLLHGWGADGDDLIDLAPYWAEYLPDAAFVSPHAPYPCDMGFGRQWFSLEDRTPEVILGQVRAVAPMIDALIDQRLAALKLEPSACALVGFSQGTMMSLFAGPRRAEPLAAIVGYSGRLLSAELLAAEARSKPPVMLIHGAQDPMVPAESMAAAEAGLAAAGFTVESHLRPGLGHGIDPEGIALAGAFLRANLPAA